MRILYHGRSRTLKNLVCNGVICEETVGISIAECSNHRFNFGCPGASRPYLLPPNARITYSVSESTMNNAEGQPSLLRQEIPKVWAIAWPLILTNILNVLVGIVDFKMVGVLGFIVGSYVNYTQYRNYYPSLHQALIKVSFLLFQFGLIACLQIVLRKLSAPRQWLWPLLLGILLTGGLSVLELLKPLSANLLPYVAAHTVTGERSHRVAALKADNQSDLRYLEPPCAVPPLTLPEHEALRVFDTYSQFPPIAKGFDLGQYNLLLITVEALRFDQTSLSDKELKTTPHLAALAEKDAYAFTQALSPSNGTQHAVGSLLSMTFPSSGTTREKSSPS